MVGRNDLCYCGSGAKYKKCCLGKDQQREVTISSFDPVKFRREMEVSMNKMIRTAESKKMSVKDLNKYFVGKDFDDINDECEGLVGDDPKRQAEELIWEAREASPCTKSIQMAKQALKPYPHLPDAWNIIAEHAGSLDEGLSYYKNAIEAG